MGIRVSETPEKAASLFSVSATGGVSGTVGGVPPIETADMSFSGKTVDTGGAEEPLSK